MARATAYPVRWLSMNWQMSSPLRCFRSSVKAAALAWLAQDRLVALSGRARLA
ncbi:hypothetical protein AB0I16_30590 [Streptomyces sp. NPDC050703]|uniref:hypothetical protein n=1 Tax=Streptomyces sp. NPDC050703 TaxID=3157218 RepID=UPI0034229EC0